MNKKYNLKFLKKCQISKSKNIKNIFSLGYLPAVNDLIPINQYAKEQKKYPTDLFYCKLSGLVQLGVVVDKKILFPKEYPYTSSTTKILRENFRNLFKEVLKKISPSLKDLVIDIGSNDGNLLDNFKNHFRVLGVTPENIGKIAIKKGIPTILDYFNSKTANVIKKKYGLAKVVTATNVFAHIDDPNKVTNLIKTILSKDGIFISESHYLIRLLKDVQYDTIYHEHQRYYSVTSLNYLFNLHGLEIFDVKKINTHGGSIRVYASNKGKYTKSKAISKIIKEEKAILNQKQFDIFKKRVTLSKLKLIKLLIQIKIENKKIAGIGAPSRSSTLINYVGLDSNLIDCIFEIKGSYKINKYAAGTKIPIKEEKIKDLNKYEYLLIFSWHIYPEIIKNLKKKGYRGSFIIPLPRPKII